MQVIEAQKVTVLEHHDHLHNKHVRECLRTPGLVCWAVKSRVGFLAPGSGESG
jgi:hypothetical protein